MVLLWASGSEIPERVQDQPSDACRVLEVDRERSEGDVPEPSDRDEEDFGLLPRASSSGNSDSLGDARVPARRQGMRGYVRNAGTLKSKTPLPICFCMQTALCLKSRTMANKHKHISKQAFFFAIYISI